MATPPAGTRSLGQSRLDRAPRTSRKRQSDHGPYRPIGQGPRSSRRYGRPGPSRRQPAQHPISAAGTSGLLIVAVHNWVAALLRFCRVANWWWRRRWQAMAALRPSAEDARGPQTASPGWLAGYGLFLAARMAATNAGARGSRTRWSCPSRAGSASRAPAPVTHCRLGCTAIASCRPARRWPLSRRCAGRCRGNFRRRQTPPLPRRAGHRPGTAAG
jgi:hypothetical protein